MKVKDITIQYTTGKKEIIKPENNVGFLVIGDKIRPSSDWNINDVYQSVSTLLLSTMSDAVKSFGTYKPLFDKLEETIGAVERQLSPAQFAKDFASKFAQGFLYQEVFESTKYPELRKETLAFIKKATDKLKEN